MYIKCFYCSSKMFSLFIQCTPPPPWRRGMRAKNQQDLLPDPTKYRNTCNDFVGEVQIDLLCLNSFC